MDVKYMKLNEIQPSQIYICKAKLDDVKTWIDVTDHNYEPLPVKKIGDKYVFTDGHTRALAISECGNTEVKVYIDMDEVDLDLYNKCIDLCVTHEIFDISSLKDRVVDCETYEDLWYKKCAELHQEIRNNR